MRYFFVPHPLSPGSGHRITGSDARHVRTVLRLSAGDTIFLLDDRGAQYEAEIVALSPAGVDVSVIRGCPVASESPLHMTVAQAFLKEKKMDGLVRQLTELGINRWIPFISRRSVARPDPGRLVARSERWRKIVRESVKQCRRGRIPEIADCVGFEAMLDLSGANDLKIIFWEEAFRPLAPDLMKTKNGRIFVVLGPEGGFSPAEVDIARDRGFISAALGPRVLRAETATIAAGALIQYLFGDLGQKRA